jgi:hypothetical protein
VVGWWEGVLQYDKAEYKDKGTRTKVKGRGLEVKETDLQGQRNGLKNREA